MNGWCSITLNEAHISFHLTLICFGRKMLVRLDRYKVDGRWQRYEAFTRDRPDPPLIRLVSA